MKWPLYNQLDFRASFNFKPYFFCHLHETTSASAYEFLLEFGSENTAGLENTAVFAYYMYCVLNKYFNLHICTFNPAVLDALVRNVHNYYFTKALMHWYYLDSS